MDDDLERFLAAQAPVLDDVLNELRAGLKRSHWMWFIFPQLKALGRSGTAQFYGLADLTHARRYAAHPVLGPRLRQCVELVLAVPSKTAHEIFDSPDDFKFRSCLTLFERASAGEPLFARALDRFYAGQRDAATLSSL